MHRILGERLALNWKIAIITIVSTILLMIDHYHFPLLPWNTWFPEWSSLGISTKVLDRTLLYLVIPMLILVVLFKEKPGIYGFTLGDWKAGLTITILGILLITPVLWFVGRMDEGMKDYYSGLASGLPWNTFLDLLGWEFLFRGWLLFGYGRKFGAEAIWLQAVPFALVHIGKPEIETISTIFGGFAFGWIAWRTKSFVYPFLIHWFVASFIIIISSYR